MEVSFELTEGDLHEVQALVYRTRSQTLWGRRRLAFAVASAAVVGWPLSGLLWKGSSLSQRAAFLLLALGLATAAVTWLAPWLATMRSARLEAWAVRRMTRAALRGSVLGPVTIALGAQALVRRNRAGELAVAWSEVHDVLHSPRVLVARLRGQQRVVVVPARAFPDAAGASRFRERLEALAGQRSVEVDPAVPLPIRAPAGGRKALLLAALGLVLVLFFQERVLPWYYDPLPGNPADHVVVYTTAWCPVCTRLRACLERHGVPFEERDVERSARAEAEWSALGGSGVPVTLAGKEVAYGLDPDALPGALAQAGYPRVDCWRD